SAFTRVFDALCAGTSGRECLETYRRPGSIFMRPRRGPAAEKFLWEGRNLQRGRELTPWNGLYDPLSSFVPVLEPRPRRGFSFGAHPAAGCASAALLSVGSVVGSGIPEPGVWRHQDVWPGSRSGEVSFLLSSVIIAVRGRPFWPRQPSRSCTTSSSLGLPSSRA